MLKICLIQPPIEDFYSTQVRNIPLGLLSLGSQLKNHHVILCDLRLGKPKKIPFPKEMQDIQQHYRNEDASPFSLYKSYYRFGTNKDDLPKYLPSDYDIYMISSQFTTYAKNVFEIIDYIKKHLSNKIIICGGSHATSSYKEFMNNGVNFVILGEGELSVKRLVKKINSSDNNYNSIPNLVWKQGSKIIINHREWLNNLDDLEYTDYNIEGTPEYSFYNRKHAMILASRGCANHCSFCCIHNTMGQKYRIRSVDNIINELSIKIKEGFRSFDFEDDHFGGNKKWFIELLDKIKLNFNKNDLIFQAMNGITATNLDKSILIKMKSIGFSTLNLSLVSTDKEEQQKLNRPFNTQKLINILHISQKLNFTNTVYLILGLPGKMPDKDLESILFLAKQPCLIGPSLFYLVPDTSIFNSLEKTNDLPKSPILYRSSYFPYARSEYTRKNAMTLFRICRMINFIKHLIDLNIIPQDFTINNDKIHINRNLNGKETQINLGYGLLLKFYQTGKIFGTYKKNKDYYQLYEENCSASVLKIFHQELETIIRIKQNIAQNNKKILTFFPLKEKISQ